MITKFEELAKIQINSFEMKKLIKMYELFFFIFIIAERKSFIKFTD